jgi:hypothetical protein
VKGTETVQYMVDGKGSISDTVENSWLTYEPVDPEDAVCPECKRNWGCLPPGAKSALEGVMNPAYGISNDREAVVMMRHKAGLPLPKWAKVLANMEKANLEVQEAVTDDL